VGGRAVGEFLEQRDQRRRLRHRLDLGAGPARGFGKCRVTEDLLDGVADGRRGGSGAKPEQELLAVFPFESLDPGDRREAVIEPVVGLTA